MLFEVTISDMKNILSYKLTFLVIACFISETALSQVVNNPTKKTAQEWVKKGEWRNGLKLNLYPGIDNVEFYKQYHRNKALWDKAFAYIRTTNFNTLPVGTYDIVGKKVYSKISEGINKDYDKTAWESHRQYIDVQLMIRGKEKIGLAHLSAAKPIMAYIADRDSIHYTAPAIHTYIADTKTLLIFFPENVHRPGIRFDGNNQFKKLVVKVSLAK
jgi:biofilm protein TabA